MKKFAALVLAMLMVISSVSAMAMTAGTYEAAAKGFHGDVKLAVTVDADKITAIEVVEHSETEGIGSVALPQLVDAVVANQTIAVDNVSGATITSEAFKAAMTDALTAAGADMAAMTAAVEKGELVEEVLDTDIVVLGGGAAGLTAGIKALQGGAKVILLEPAPRRPAPSVPSSPPPPRLLRTSSSRSPRTATTRITCRPSRTLPAPWALPLTGWWLRTALLFRTRSPISRPLPSLAKAAAPALSRT